MNYLNKIYGCNLALATDLYELTMAQGYWKCGVAESEAVFHMFFRKNPFKGGFIVTAGISFLIEFIENFRFTDDDIKYLRTLKGNDGKALFDNEFLNYLSSQKFDGEIDSVTDGTIVFPYEPVLRVKGKILQAQILETAILNIINFHSLIATKAARVCLAANGDPVIEFGMRRAHSIGGSLGASWAAYIGGCEATSNVLAGKLFGIPVRGTHAHSWVQFFDSEYDAFMNYAKGNPNNGIFLVDTYDTKSGVYNAIQAGKYLNQNGYKFFGIRIDSGNLENLSKEARKILDENGFKDTKIIASGDLDEWIIDDLKSKKAPIDIWGVGTKLVTGYNEPFLTGVYKLSMAKKEDCNWIPKMKISEENTKTSIPGILQVRRYSDGEYYLGDMIYDITLGVKEEDSDIATSFGNNNQFSDKIEKRDLLIPIFRHGKRVYNPPEISKIKEYVNYELSKLKPMYKSLMCRKNYPVVLEKNLTDMKRKFIRELKRRNR